MGRSFRFTAVVLVLLLGLAACGPDLVSPAAGGTSGNGSLPGQGAAFGFNVFRLDAEAAPLPTIEVLSLEGADAGLEVLSFWVVDRGDAGLGIGAGPPSWICDLRRIRADGPVDLDGFVETLSQTQVIVVVAADDPGTYAAEGVRLRLGRREFVAGNRIELQVFDPTSLTDAERESRLDPARACVDSADTP